MDGRVKIAHALIKARNYGPATTALSRYLAARPHDLDALFLYGTAHYRANNHIAAEDAFRRFTAAAPNNAKGHYSLGLTLLRLGRTEQARDAFLRSLQLDPSLEPARQRLAQINAAPGPPPPGSSSVATNGQGDSKLDEGVLLRRGHRRVGSFADRFLGATLLAVVGLLVVITHEPGRLRFLAENPPLQFPSIGFLRGQFRTTGQQMHREELEAALARAASLSDFFDGLLLALAVGLVVLAAAWVFHAFLAAHQTIYEIYERRIDMRTGVLNRRRSYAWLFEITDVELRQTPMLTLTRNAEIRVYLAQDSIGTIDNERRSTLRIIGFGSLDDQERFYHELRNAAIKERRALKNWFI